MTWLWRADDMFARIAFVRLHTPQDVLTLIARSIVYWTTWVIGVLLYPIDHSLRYIGRFAPVELLFFLTISWWPIWGLLVGSSWLWLRLEFARPVLFLPGVFIGIFAYLYLMLVPDPEKFPHYTSLAQEWPLS